jgi:hypothetical protein
MEETKKIAIKGGAIDDYTKQKGIKKRTTRKQNGGFDKPPDGTEIPISPANMKAMSNITKVIKSGGGETLTGSNPNPQPEKNIEQMPALKAASSAGTIPPSNPVTTPPSSSPSQTPAPLTGGKLVLAPKKKTKSKVILAPPTHEKKLKRGHTRKIRLQVSNMKKRFSTAKVIHKDSKEKSIEDIRKLLEEAKLIKPAKEGKKVPDEILRSIYKDYLLLRNKAL